MQEQLVAPPAFESIKKQMKRNSIPNAQSIQQHIDKLISQNEAIVDNWNSVSIRAYNSTRDCLSGAKRSSHLPAASLSTATTSTPPTTATPTPTATTTTTNQTRALASNSSSNLNLNLSNRPKRWSTSVLEHQPLSSAQSIASSTSDYSTGSSAETLSPQGSSSSKPQTSLSHPINFRLREVQRKRSYNLAKQTSNCFVVRGTEQIGGAHLSSSPALADPRAEFSKQNSTSMIASLPTPVFFSHDSNAQDGQSKATEPDQSNKPDESKPEGPPPAHLQEQPVQPDESIQNLSLKKNSENSSRCHLEHSQARYYQVNPLTGLYRVQSHLSPSFVHENGASSHQRDSLLGVSSPESQFLFNRHHQHELQQNLTPSQSLVGPDNERLVMAALIMEHQRQLLAAEQSYLQQLPICHMSPGGRDLIYGQHHCDQHKESIEQQLDKLRLTHLAASLEHQQQMSLMGPMVDPLQGLHTHHHHHHHHFNQLTADATPMAINNLLVDRRTLMDSHLLGDIQSKMMMNCEDLRLLRQDESVSQSLTGSGHTGELLEHSDEMLTESLDSSKPTHRCEPCDIYFWTKDLLNYHKLTQCRERNEAASSSSNERSSCDQESGKKIMPTAYNFNRPNDFDSEAHSAIFSKSASPPRTDLARHEKESREDSVLALDGSQAAPDTSSTLNKLEGISILKNQLQSNTSASRSQTQANGTSNLESLPFKKRKISEPNMRY